MRIALIYKPGHENTGVGRYSNRLYTALIAQRHEVLIVHPSLPFPMWLARFVRHLFGWDLQAFFENYPVLARYPAADLYHLTSQNLATLLFFCSPPSPIIITVHDIIPYITKHNKETSPYMHLFDRIFDGIAIGGLKKANQIIAVSETTRQIMISELGLDLQNTIVIPEGIG